MKDLLKQPHIIFSVENPMHTPTEKAPSQQKMIERLKTNGEDAHAIKGKYRLPENSIIVFNPKSPKDIKRIAKVLGQDSIIYSTGHKNALIYVNGDKEDQIEYGVGTVFHEKAPKDFYSVLPDGTIFTHQIGNLKKSEDLQKSFKVNLNPEHGKTIADAYEKMQHNPNDPQVKQAYGALINETAKQYQDLLNSGYKFTKVTDPKQYPYKNSKQMHQDIEQNKHLYYLPTHGNFGPDESVPKDHPLLAQTNFKSSDNQPMVANDILRQVHDINGHFYGGKTTFGPIGEHQAYLNHKKMYSEKAQPALANELIMQNNYVNFGPHGEHNRKNPSDTKYAPQKVGLVPDWVWKGKWHE